MARNIKEIIRYLYVRREISRNVYNQKFPRKRYDLYGIYSGY